MRTRRSIGYLWAVVIATLAVLLALPPLAQATPDPKKAIWGPVSLGGQSQFPIYADLGAGIYEYSMSWATVAPTRPRDPANPADPAYHWPAELDLANSEAQRYGMKVSVLLLYAPPWANGGKPDYFAPRNPRDFANFAAAASRRYPSVNLWMIWGEPSIASHFAPFSRMKSPRRYASLLDASYGALKSVNPHNLVIGGNTITTGDVRPLDWIRRMKLPNGRPPRMDMYGHNPFSPREPNLKSRPVKRGLADTSDLDSLTGWLDRYLHRGKRNRNLKIFISEWTIPTEQGGNLFGFWADQQTVARYLSRALAIDHQLPRVYTLGWFYLYDEQPNAAGNQNNWGLLTYNGTPKPAYYAFKNG
jgi:hypothetical protein